MSHIDDATLYAYVDDALETADQPRVELHLEACEACRTRVAEARRDRSRASELLGELEPGPVHAPAFAELRARAGHGEGAASAAVPLWRRPSLAWAASLLIAFGLGWMSRIEIGVPGAPEQTSSETSRDSAAAAEVPLQEAVEIDALAPIGEEASDQDVKSDDALQVDDLRASAKRTTTAQPSEEAAAPPAASPVAEPEPAQAPPTAGSLPGGRRNQDAGAGVASRAGGAVTPARRADQPRPAAAGAVGDSRLRMEAVPVTGASPFVELRRDFVDVDPAVAEAWLGAVPRQLSEHQLVRAEVGPGGRLRGGVAGRPAVRFVYRDVTGKEIVLVQQYLGEAQRPADVPANRAADEERPEIRAARAAENAREAPSSEIAERRLAEVEAFGNLPLTEVEPGGLVVYRWIDDDGYLLSLAGVIDRDVIRGLAERVR